MIAVVALPGPNSKLAEDGGVISDGTEGSEDAWALFEVLRRIPRGYIGIYRDITSMRENQMEKKMEHEMDTCFFIRAYRVDTQNPA